MAFSVGMKLEGMGAVLAQLDDLARGAKNRIIRPAVNAAGQIVLKAARSKVQVDSGITKESLIKKVKTYSGGVVAVIGPDAKVRRTVFRSKALFGKGANVLARPAYTAHLVEKGTKPHPLARGSRLAGQQKLGRGLGMHPGTQPHPFLRPALEDNRAAIIAEMTKRIQEGLEAYHRKQAGA